jgi:aspartyl-tRNA synthetase
MAPEKSTARDASELLTSRKNTNQLSNLDFGKDVVVAGYINNMREVGKKLAFSTLSDQFGEIQITYKADQCKNFTDFKGLSHHTFVLVEGTLVQGKAKEGREIEARQFILLSDLPAQPIPIDIYNTTTGMEKRLDYRWIDLRSPANRLPIILLSNFISYARKHFTSEGYIEIFSPKIVGHPTEGGAELFMIPYFSREAYLAQSPQFYKQMAICSGLEKVFEIGPVFRANPSFTTRHDTEFTSLDMEIAYISSHHDVMAAEERMLNSAFSEILKNDSRLINSFGQVDVRKPGRIPKIKMEEAYSIVAKENINAEGDINPAGERELAKYIEETYDNQFVFLTDYPLKARPFYHMIGEPMTNGTETTKSFDLIYKGVEITTGAQREHNYEKLVSNIERKGLKAKNLTYYVDLFKYGAPPHGGLGFGPTRVIMQLLGKTNVREVTFAPRDPKRLNP